MSPFFSSNILRVISAGSLTPSKRLVALAENHPETRAAIVNWYRAARTSRWLNLVDVRETINTADQVGRVLVFNILGGNYRLIVTANWSRQQLFFKSLLTHTEYYRGNWRTKWQ